LAFWLFLCDFWPGAALLSKHLVSGIPGPTWLMVLPTSFSTAFSGVGHSFFSSLCLPKKFLFSVQFLLLVPLLFSNDLHFCPRVFFCPSSRSKKNSSGTKAGSPGWKYLVWPQLASSDVFMVEFFPRRLFLRQVPFEGVSSRFFSLLLFRFLRPGNHALNPPFRTPSSFPLFNPDPPHRNSRFGLTKRPFPRPVLSWCFLPLPFKVDDLFWKCSTPPSVCQRPLPHDEHVSDTSPLGRFPYPFARNYFTSLTK